VSLDAPPVPRFPREWHFLVMWDSTFSQHPFFLPRDKRRPFAARLLSLPVRVPPHLPLSAFVWMATSFDSLPVCS